MAVPHSDDAIGRESGDYEGIGPLPANHGHLRLLFLTRTGGHPGKEGREGRREGRKGINVPVSGREGCAHIASSSLVTSRVMLLHCASL